MLGKLLDGRYRVIQVLSSGGFGETYIAQDTRRPSNPECVVKHLKPASNDPKNLQIAQRLFYSEAEILEKLGNHNQIPQLLAYFEDNQEFYLVQQFIIGHPLTAELPPGQRWTPNQVLQMLEDVLGVLDFIHADGVIHRDIKPENLIRRHQDGRLVLIDFGAVKQVRTQLNTIQGQVTSTVAVGTPGYMPAEQSQGKPRPNSDIYALGMIAIQALTGLTINQMQEDPDTGEIIWQHQARVSPRFAAILNNMVRCYFRDRYQSAAEVLQALQELTTPYLPPPVTPHHHPTMLLTTVTNYPPALPARRTAKAIYPRPQYQITQYKNKPIIAILGLLCFIIVTIALLIVYLED